MTSGQNDNDFSFDVTASSNTTLDTGTSANFFMQTQTPKDYSGATVHFEGKNNESIEIRIGGVNCGQLRKILDLVENIKCIIGEKEGQKIDFPTYPQYPFYPQYPYIYPNNPFEPTITWCNNSADDTNKTIKEYVESRTKDILKTQDDNQKLQKMVMEAMIKCMNQDQVIKGATHLDDEIHDVEITEDDEKRFTYDED